MASEMIEKRRKIIAEYAKEYKPEHIPYLLPKHLWKNVLLETIEQGNVKIKLYGDDYIDEGFVKRIELRFKAPIKLSLIRNWQKESLVKAIHWILAINKAVEPPKEFREDERLKEIKEMLSYIEDMKKKYLIEGQ
jgi:hypothetical protein